MNRLAATVVALTLIAPAGAQAVAIDPVAADSGAAPTIPSDPFLLGPPEQPRPVIVEARFDLHDINEINDQTETFELAGVLTLEWIDPRRAFDPAAIGAGEKVFQGDFQFNEISTGWYPQVYLVNEAGLFQRSAVTLRVRPDGHTTLIQTLNAVAEAEFDMTDYPFDAQRLEAVFELLGFDRDEVLLSVDPDEPGLSAGVRTPQWTINNVGVSVGDRSGSYAGPMGVSSTLVLRVEVERLSWYVRRLVVLPLLVIVVLSFSVFWMDRSSLGDRVSVSFIGILTAVAYQIVTSEQLPHISYFTVIHAFLGWSFLVMCATVVVNLVVGGLDKRGKNRLGDRVDWHCRWVFPLAYFAPIVAMLGVEFLLL